MNPTTKDITIPIKKFIIDSGLIHTKPISPAAPGEIFITFVSVTYAHPAADPTIAA